MNVAEMKKLRLMNEVTKENKIRNECKRSSIGVASKIYKIREIRLRWFGYILSTKETETGRLVQEIYVKGMIK